MLLKLVEEGPLIDIDHSMPPELRDEAFDRDQINRFWCLTFALWLVDDKFGRLTQGRTSNNPIKIKWEDFIDLEKMGFVKEGETISI